MKRRLEWIDEGGAMRYRLGDGDWSRSTKWSRRLFMRALAALEREKRERLAQRREAKR